MKMKKLALLVGVLLSLSAPMVAAAQSDEPTATPDATDQVEVAGVQTSPQDARMPDESEPYIINDGFGD